MGWLLLTASVAPVAFMLHFVYIRDRYEREPLGRVLLVFFVSFFTVIPAALFESIFRIPEDTGLIGVAVSAWCIIALAEETVKYLALRYLAVPHRSFNEVYDGILYSVAASLGFAVVENIAYVFFSEGQGLGIAVGRALLSIPGHALWGVMMGYYVGKAKFEPDPARKKALVLTGVLLAIFWHGLYDFCVFATQAGPEETSMLFTWGLLAVIVINWIIGLRLIKRAQAESVFKRPSPMQNPILAFAPHLRFCHYCGAKLLRETRFCMNCGHELPE